MYTPKLFLEQDPDRLFACTNQHNFATLIVPDGTDMEISHLPFLVDRVAGKLLAHVARGNRVWELAAAGRQATVVFHGPHGYVSPRWYEEPTRQVPTWNYAVVHVHGHLQGPLAREELLNLLARLTQQHEADASEPWSMAKSAPELIDSLVKGIVGFSLEIERIEGKFKLSQNRSLVDQARVVAALDKRGEGDDAELVRLMHTVLK